MKKELEFFKIENNVGWNQDLFNDPMMRIGGCAAVTACDCSIFLSIHHNIKDIYPLNNKTIFKEDYINFSKIIKPYLHPRMMGINKTSTYIEGFSNYLKDSHVTSIKLDSFNGNLSDETAFSKIKSLIDEDLPIPYLLLLHKNKVFNEYIWHWFLITGYNDEDKSVQITTFGKSLWFDFKELWNTGKNEKGGFIVINKLTK